MIFHRHPPSPCFRHSRRRRNCNSVIICSSGDWSRDYGRFWKTQRLSTIHRRGRKHLEILSKGSEENEYVKYCTWLPKSLRVLTSMLIARVLMPRCPFCGEQLSWSDRNHIREKHPKYFHEVRKWQLLFTFCLIPQGVFLIINGVFSQDLFFRRVAAIGNFIALSFTFFTLFKWRSAAKKYKVPWKKTLPLTGTNN